MVKTIIRPLQYKDLEAISQYLIRVDQVSDLVALGRQLELFRNCYGLLKFLALFPNPWQNHFRAYVAEESQKLIGLVQVEPENISRSTWRVKQVLTMETSCLETGSQLLRYCFESLWEARTWILEVNIEQKDTLALYRQNGFQPIAHLTHWSLSPSILAGLAEKSSDLVNLMPVSNADAQLLYQLDCVSMPPLLRQVFDRHVQDFKKGLLNRTALQFKNWWTGKDFKEAYVFEPQRKAAIAYFNVQISHNSSQPHQLQLTVHPAYTWLYGPILVKIAQIIQNYPSSLPLELVSADYQPEREECLEQIAAERVEHTLLMSRSVWHKLREVKQEGLQLSDMLQGLKSVPRSPIPTRFSPFAQGSQNLPLEISEKSQHDSSNDPSNGHRA
jgi:hypothetical protein